MPIEGPPVVTPPVVTPVVSGFTFATVMRLVDPDSGSELFRSGPFTPTVLNSLDFGYPDIRASASSMSGAHGTWDTTRWMGARTLTAEMTLPQGPAADTALDTFQSLLNPGLRLWLYAQRPGWETERRIKVRTGTYTCAPGTSRKAQVGWVAPSGLFESPDLTQVTLSPAGSSTTGLTVPLTVPIVITGGLVAGAASVVVEGTIGPAPTIDIYGPCANPKVELTDTGELVSFPGLTVANGDYLHVDMAARTVTLNGDPKQNLYYTRDFAASSWWTLPIGPAVGVLFTADAVAPPCQAVMSWRNSWL